MWKGIINRIGMKNKEKSALWPDFIYFSPVRTHFYFDWMYVDFTLICFLRLDFDWFWLNVCRFLPVFSFKIFGLKGGGKMARSARAWLALVTLVASTYATTPVRAPATTLRDPPTQLRTKQPSRARQTTTTIKERKKRKKKYLKSSIM